MTVDSFEHSTKQSNPSVIMEARPNSNLTFKIRFYSNRPEHNLQKLVQHAVQPKYPPSLPKVVAKLEKNGFYRQSINTEVAMSYELIPLRNCMLGGRQIGCSVERSANPDSSILDGLDLGVNVKSER
jgi:hypothetical protein